MSAPTHRYGTVPPEKRVVEYARLACQWCGVRFELRPSDVKKGKGRFCSRRCSGSAGHAKQAGPPRAAAPAPADQQPIPEYRWPDERHLAPRQCPHCGSRMLHDDVPYGFVKTGERRCFTCSRVSNTWRAGLDDRPSAAVEPSAEDASSICLDCGNLTGQRETAAGKRRLRCQPCSLEHERATARERSRNRYWGVGR